MSRLEAGSAVVVVGQGAGRIVCANEETAVVCLTGGEVTVRLADAGHLLRVAVDREQANRHLQRLCERCAEPRSLPGLRSIRELARAPLHQQIEYLRWYFRKRKALYPREDEMIQAVTDAVIEELALALDADPLDLRAAIKRGRPIIERRERPTLPPAPELSGCSFLRSFWLGTRAVIGERPEADEDTRTISVQAGAWHAYHSAAENEEGAGGLLLRHADLRPDTVRVPTIVLGSVNVEGGTVGVLDKGALTDDEFGVDEVERTRSLGEGYGDRGVEVSTEGDGSHTICADAKKGATTLLVRF